MKVLITGGSGSFGRAMTERLLDVEDVTRIAIYSRGEHAQADMAQTFHPLDLHNKLRFFIGDVRDRDRLRRAFRDIDVVFHAAALKRIEVGAYNPDEMKKTNIDGAMNVIEAARDSGVQKVVALSTDKAWQPISPYGQSKALAETLFRNACAGGPIFSVTRYGNIWKSAGSVVPKWQALLKRGAPITITDPNCTRFYMTMDNATSFVLAAAETMKGGELFVPKLPAYRLGDLLDAIMGDNNRVPIEFTGLPSWEKLHEGMEDGNTSDIAQRMTVDELRAAL